MSTSGKHRDALSWITARYDAPGPVELRVGLVKTHNQRRRLAQAIRTAAEPIRDTERGEALRCRAFLLELEEQPTAAAELLAEAEVLGIEVVE